MKLFQLIEYYQQLPKHDMPLCIGQAVKRFYNEDSANPYYVVPLLATKKPLIFHFSKQLFICNTQHLTVFSINKDARDVDDLHYTGEFVSEDGVNFTLHVFLKSNNEAVSVDWYSTIASQQQPSHRQILDAVQIKEVMQYAVEESKSTLEVLNQLHMECLALIATLKKQYKTWKSEFQTIFFDNNIDTQRDSIAKAKKILAQLISFHIDGFQYELDLWNKVEHSLDAVPLTIPAVTENSEIKDSASSGSAVLIKTPQTTFFKNRLEQSTTQAAPLSKAKQLVLWAAFENKIKNASAEYPRIPKSGLNDPYLTRMCELERAYQELSVEYLLLPFSKDRKIVDKIKTVDHSLKALNTLHAKNMKTCVEAILDSGQENETTLQALELLAHWIPDVDDKILEMLANTKKTRFLSALLGHHFTLRSLVSIKAYSSTQKIFLEWLIENRNDCLFGLIKHLNADDLLVIGSNNQPLIFRIFELEIFDGFRQRCFDEIPALRSQQFYNRLIKMCEDKGDDERALTVRIEMHANTELRRDDCPSYNKKQLERLHEFHTKLLSFNDPLLSRLSGKILEKFYFDSEIQKFMKILKSHLKLSPQNKDKIAPYLENWDAEKDLPDSENLIDEIELPEVVCEINMMHQSSKALYQFLLAHFLNFSRKQQKNAQSSDIEKALFQYVTKKSWTSFIKAEEYLTIRKKQRELSFQRYITIIKHKQRRSSYLTLVSDLSYINDQKELLCEQEDNILYSPHCDLRKIFNNGLSLSVRSLKKIEEYEKKLNAFSLNSQKVKVWYETADEEIYDIYALRSEHKIQLAKAAIENGETNDNDFPGLSYLTERFGFAEDKINGDHNVSHDILFGTEEYTDEMIAMSQELYPENDSIINDLLKYLIPSSNQMSLASNETDQQSSTVIVAAENRNEPSDRDNEETNDELTALSISIQNLDMNPNRCSIDQSTNNPSAIDILVRNSVFGNYEKTSASLENGTDIEQDNSVNGKDSGSTPKKGAL